MERLVGLALLLYYMTAVGAWKSVRSKRRFFVDPLHPIVAFSAFWMAGALYLVLVGPDILASHPRPEGISGNSGIWLMYGFLAMIAFTSTLAGLSSHWAASCLAYRLPLRRLANSSVRPFAPQIVFGLGLLFFAAFLVQIGGISQLLSNLQRRTVIAAGTGYLSFVYSTLLVFGVLLGVARSRDRHEGKGGRLLYNLPLVVLGSAVLLITAGRYNAALLFVLLLLASHYWFQQLSRWFDRRLIGVVLLVLILVAVVPLFRAGGGVQSLSANEKVEALERGPLLLQRISPIERQVDIVRHFSPSNVWLGSSYLDLALAPVPRNWNPAKPPVDEGVYFRAIAGGQEAAPSMPASSLPLTSWPPGNWIGYANFWVPGLVLWHWVGGVLILACYKYLLMARSSPLALYMYGYAVYGGEFLLTNLGIVRAVMVVSLAVATLLLTMRPCRQDDSPSAGRAA